MGTSRRRKPLSYDGSTPGIEFNRLRGHQTYAGTPGLEGLAQKPDGHPRQQEQYDPTHPQYPTDPGYGVPDEWDAIELHPRTPLLRFERPQQPPRPIRYEDSRLSPALFDFMMRDVLDTLHEDVAAARDTGPFPANHDVRFFPDAPAFAETPTVPVDLPFGAFTPDFFPPPAHALEAEPAAIAASIPLGAAGLPPVSMSEASSFTGMSEPPEAAPLGSELTLVQGPTLDAVVAAPDPFDMMAEAFDPTRASPDPMTLAPLLDMIVEQLAPEPPPQPDPFLLMGQLYDQQLQLMDPFNPMGPMGL